MRLSKARVHISIAWQNFESPCQQIAERFQANSADGLFSLASQHCQVPVAAAAVLKTTSRCVFSNLGMDSEEGL